MMPEPDDSADVLRKAAEVIAECTSIWIGAGAGMGVDSGLPDFRGNEGFWNAYPPYRHLGLDFYDLANPKWFASKPAQAWGFYGHRLQLYRETQPHEGFQILRRWTQEKNDNYFIFTSNVDGQFQAAGFDDDRVVECHGSIHHMQCSGPCSHMIWSAESFVPAIDEQTMQAAEPLPHCKKCERVARPNILMFGDWNWIDDRAQKQSDRYCQWLSGNDRNCAILEFGAGTAVPTVRYEAQRTLGTIIRVNPREPETHGDGISVPCGALEFLQTVDELIS